MVAAIDGAVVSDLRLYDATLTLTRIVRDYDSVVATRRFFDYSEVTGNVPASEYANISAAKYITMGADDTVYLMEWHELDSDGSVKFGGRDATAVLESRTLEGTFVWNDRTHGYIALDIIANMTGDRAVMLVAGDGASLGTSIDMQRSWGNAGEVLREVLSAAALSIRPRLSTAGTIVADVFAPAVSGTYIGDKFRNASNSRLRIEESEWRNYAYVLGEELTPSSVNASSATLVAGSSVAGSSANINATDASYWTIGENGTTGITLEMTFPIGATEYAGDFIFNGYYNGSPTAHHLELWAYDEVAGHWEELQEFFIPSNTIAGYMNSAPFAERHINRTTNSAKFRIVHNVTTYNASHRLYVDRVQVQPGGSRERVEVDWTSGNPRRELYVDARDLQREVDGIVMSLVEYRAALAARGAEKLAETRRVEFATADTDTPLSVGDVAWYDSGTWSAWLMASEVNVAYERGSSRVNVTLGEPPATLRKTIRRVT